MATEIINDAEFYQSYEFIGGEENYSSCGKP